MLPDFAPDGNGGRCHFPCDIAGNSDRIFRQWDPGTHKYAVRGRYFGYPYHFSHSKARLQTDAAIGVTFTWLFALGVILISVFAGQVDLDQECVLYGEIAYVPIDLWITDSGQIMGPRVIYLMGTVFLLVLTFIIIGYKELFLTTFDPNFAAATGVSVGLWHYLLMGAVSFTTVGAFESVGAILVVALIIVPPATAYLLIEDFKKMLLLTAGIGVIISFIGYYLAVWLDGSIAGAMSVVAGFLFGLAFLLSPQNGILVKSRGHGAWRREHGAWRRELGATQFAIN